jgi:hypothetical protein
MRKSIVLFFIVAAIMASSTRSNALVFYPMADSFTSSGYPAVNFNYHSGDLDAELWTGNFLDGSAARSYFKFNLTGLYNVDSAALYLYNGVNSGTRSSFDPAGVEVYSASALWSERTITWNNQPALEILGAGAVVGSAVGWYSWNITSLAQAKANGILSLGLSSSGAGHVYYGRESESLYMPYLVTTVPEPATIATFGSFCLIFLPFIRRRPML